MRRSRQELGSFCQQFDLSIQNPTCSGNYSKPNTKPNKPPYKKPAHKYKKRFLYQN
jgi:hypothetical protein